MERMTLQTVRDKVLFDDQRKSDFITTFRDIEIEPNGFANLKSRERYDDGSLSDDFKYFQTSLSPQAMSQYYSMLGIPVGYASKIPFDLMAPHIQYAKSMMNQDSAIFTRTINLGGEAAPAIYTRALLTERYGIIDNLKVVDSIIDVLGGSLEVQDYHVDQFSDMLNLRLIDKDYRQYGHDPSGKSNPYYAGLHITNGETGKMSISMAALIFEQWCLNGAVREKFGEALLRMKHLGSHIRLNEELHRSSIMLPDVYENSMDKFSKSQGLIINQPEIALYNLMRSNTGTFDKHLMKETFSSFDRRNENTVYGIASAITEAAQKTDYERRLRAEKVAGNLIFFDLPADTHGDRSKVREKIQEIRDYQVA